MCTARALAISPSMLCTEGCVPGPGGGIPGPGRMYLVPGSAAGLGGVPGPGGT